MLLARAHRTLSTLSLKPYDRVLDLGCGCGYLTQYIATLAPHMSVLGLDILPANIEAARARYGSDRHQFEVRDCRHLVEAEADDTHLADESFDKVYSYWAMQLMLVDAPAADCVFRGVHRMLKVNELFAFEFGWTEAMTEDYGICRDILLKSGVKERSVRRINQYFFEKDGEEKMKRLMAEIGFDVVSWRRAWQPFGEEHGLEDWVKKFVGGWINKLGEPAKKERARKEICDRLREIPQRWDERGSANLNVVCRKVHV